MRTPRLLIISTVANMLRGFLLPFPRHFQELGWQVDAMANGVSESQECKEAFNHVLEIGWSRNPLSHANFRGPVARVREVVTQGDYDIVHVHTPVASLVSRFALRRFDRRSQLQVIYTAHGFHFYDGGPRVRNCAFRTLERLAGRWTDYLVVINRWDERSARTYRVVPHERLVYMPGIGLDTETKYHPASVSPAEIIRVRSELGLTPQHKMLLMIAEFNPGKRHADALRGMARITSDTVHLVFAGDGCLLEETKALAVRLGVAHRVHFLGHRSDICALIRASSATLLTSDREGLPRSIMEAMSLGVPVIATDIRGNRDLLGDGRGILVPVGDGDALASAIRWVTENGAEAARMAGLARERTRSFDLRRILQLHEELYSRALCSLNKPALAKADGMAAGVPMRNPGG